MWMFLSRVKARISAGAVERARSATKTSARILRVVDRALAKSSRRSRRRAVRTRFAPPAANASARALPMPALAPVTKAHFPCHASIDLAKSLRLLLRHFDTALCVSLVERARASLGAGILRPYNGKI